jgi:nucleosome assembly protein 1-like 1
MTTDLNITSEIQKLSEHSFFQKDSEHAEIDESYANLPTDIRFRVEALRKLQLNEVQAKTDLEEKQLILQKQYYQRLEKSHDSRKRIISGECEPSSADLLKQVVDDKNFKPSKSVKGIPGFWFQVLSNSPMTKGWIEEEDHVLLKAVKDVRVKYGNDKDVNGVTTRGGSSTGDVGIENADTLPNKFVVEFEFYKNEYINDTILRKTYYTSCEPDTDPTESPFNYVGQHIKEHEGQMISWKKDKCLTYQIIRKKQKNAKSGGTRVVTRKEKFDSFFNFFEKSGLETLKVDMNDDDAKHLEKAQELEEDFELGLYFRDTLVPNAVLLFTNEFQDADFDSDSASEEDSDEEDESDGSGIDTDSGDEEGPTGTFNQFQCLDNDQEEKPECKQQ